MKAAEETGFIDAAVEVTVRYESGKVRKFPAGTWARLVMLIAKLEYEEELEAFERDHGPPVKGIH